MLSADYRENCNYKLLPSSKQSYDCYNYFLEINIYIKLQLLLVQFYSDFY